MIRNVKPYFVGKLGKRFQNITYWCFYSALKETIHTSNFQSVFLDTIIHKRRVSISGKFYILPLI